MSSAEEIKSKLDIVEVLREYIQVKAAGANFQALCPFHREKSPSFVISPDKQIWHCFGCGKGGDVLSFVQEMEGLSFPDTLRLLAPKAGVVLKQENKEEYSKKSRLFEILDLAAKYYQYTLSGTEAKKATEYLTNRKLTEQTIKEWEIGYSPNDWSRLYSFLKVRPKEGKKFSDNEIFESGVVIKKERGGGYYDRFRNRVMFPISDSNGRKISFTARVLPGADEKLGKYVNGPKTELYNKSEVLFGFDKAKKYIKQEDLAIIVEGQMDVITCHQFGYKNVIASSGTALSLAQIKKLQSFTQNIAFALDSDTAGNLASEKGGDLIETDKIEKVLSISPSDRQIDSKGDGSMSKISLFIIEISNGKDADESLNKDPEAFKNAICDKKPYYDYIFSRLFDNFDVNDSISVKNATYFFIDKLSRLADNVSKSHWLSRVSEKTKISEEVLRELVLAATITYEGTKPRREAVQNVNMKQNIVEQVGREDRLVEILFALLLKSPDFIHYAASHLEPEDLEEESRQKFYRNLIIYYNKFAHLDYDSFRLYLQEQADGSVSMIDRLALLGEKDYYNYDDNQIKAEVTKIIVEMKKFSLKRRIKLLQDKIASSEASGDEGMDILMTEMKNLTEQLNALQSL